jgi:hypothetical protein
VQVTPYSFSSPKIRRSITAVYGWGSRAPGALTAAAGGS